MNTQQHDKYELARDTALGWIARLRSDQKTAEDQQSFALWLAEDLCHRQAMDEMLELWSDLAVVKQLYPATDSGSTPAAELPRKSANQSRWIAGGITTAACLMLAIFLWPQTDSAPYEAHYQTSIGERRSIDLPEGSVVMLNADTSISLSFTENERRIELREGEAWFQVTPNKQRPFIVDAGEASVTALGTAFNIYRSEDGTNITVTEGVVRVSELGETGSRIANTEVLHQQQALSINSQGWQLASSEAGTDNAELPLAWQRGELVAQEMPLPELLSQLQPYFSKQVLITDPSLSVLTVSGVFQLDQPEATLKALALSLDIEIAPLDNNALQLLKTEQ